jgi:two-component system nitrogen regulation sensor histidine kinase NtrY
MLLHEPAHGPREQPPRRLLDRPRVLVAAAIVLIALMGALFWLADRTSQMAPQFLSDVLLYGLLAVNLLLLAALFFVLVRNLLKLWVEQRRAAPFARFRAKLVAALLAMTILPAVLVLLSGSQIIRDSAARWFSEPVEDVLVSAQEIARQYYREGQERSALHARRIARMLPPAAFASGDGEGLTARVQDEPRAMRNGLIELYGVAVSDGGGRGDSAAPDLVFLGAVGSANLPRGQVAPSADRIAARVVAAGAEQSQQDDLAGGGVLLRTAVPVAEAGGPVAGVLVVSHYLAPDVQAWALEATAAYESYQGLRMLEAPIQGIYQSVFLAVSLLILISATWLGLYLAKRITRPVQMLAEGARAIGAGQFDLQLEAETADELGSLVESFNMMALQLRSSRERLEASRQALEQKTFEIDARRRYIETVLDRVATGVISLDASGHILTVNGAAERLLNLGSDVYGRPVSEAFEREDLRPLLPLARAVVSGGSREVNEITLTRDDREVNLAVAATMLVGDDGRPEGAVLVLDDVTLLFRAQRVAAWRDVARRLAHEVKNPLTPIQLSAQRLRRHFGHAPEPTRALVTECTDAIVTEVEVLKGLVDEFAEFARLRAPRMQAADLNRLLERTLHLYAGVLVDGGLTMSCDLEPGLPPVLLDAEQMRQVVINLVDNAMEVLGGPSGPPTPAGQPPAIVVRTRFHEATGRVHIDVTDNGPGVSAADKDKLFMPYYSTKGRGSGLGLAIVRRIVADHGGTIEVLGAEPSGTTFRIDLPCLRS